MRTNAQVQDRHELTITREYDAPRALVFRMWTDPEHMRVWSCPRGFTIPEAEGGKAAPGETFRVTMRGPDGTTHRMQGRYLVVQPVELLSFTHSWEEADGLSPETTVTVRLEETASGGTRLTLHQGFFTDVASRDGHEAGWTESLDKLAEHLAS